MFRIKKYNLNIKYSKEKEMSKNAYSNLKGLIKYKKITRNEFENALKSGFLEKVMFGKLVMYCYELGHFNDIYTDEEPRDEHSWNGYNFQ